MDNNEAMREKEQHTLDTGHTNIRVTIPGEVDPYMMWTCREPGCTWQGTPH